MKFLYSFLLLTLVWVACSNKDKMPPDILPPDKMKEVMWDMIRAGEYLNSFVLFKDSSVDKTAESQKWYDKVYQLHKISKEKFEKSFKYYQEHPLLMKTIFDSLSKRQVDSSPVPATPADSAKAPAGKKLDSIPVQHRDTLKRNFDTLIRKKILKKRKTQPLSGTK